MRGIDELQVALAASDAVARSAKHHLMFKRAGVEYGAATEFASRIADDLYARLGEHVIVKAPKWRLAAIRRIQASWMGGVVVAGHLEAVSLDEQHLTYEELDDAYEMLHAGPSFDFLPSDEIVRDLELDVSATRRAAGMVALDALPDLICAADSPRLSDDDEVACAAALASAWLDGLLIGVHARRQRRKRNS